MRNVPVYREFQNLWIHHDESQLVRSKLHEEGHQHGVDTNGLT